MYELFSVVKWGQIYTYQGQDGGEEGTVLCAMSFRFVSLSILWSTPYLGGKLKSEYKTRLPLIRTDKKKRCSSICYSACGEPFRLSAIENAFPYRPVAFQGLQI